MPELELGDLEDDPSLPSEPSDALTVPSAIDCPAVEQLALHLHHDLVDPVGEVDPADPPVGVAEVDLAFERVLAGLLEDPLEPALEVALRRPVSRGTAADEVPQLGGPSPTAVRRQGLEQRVELPEVQEAAGQQAVAHLGQPIGVHPPGEVPQ